MPCASRDLGRAEYAPVWAQMKALRAARSRGEVVDTLLLVEHPPVVTVGVEGEEALPAGLPVYRVERGGKATYHGPGQLVGYPVVDLAPRGKDVRRFVGDLEAIMIEASAAVGVTAGRVDGRRGIWVDGERKLGSVGIALESWVSYHGFALNVATDLEAFRSFPPCGFDGRIMTSLSRETGRPVSLDEVKPSVLRAWERRFGVGPP